MMDFSDMSLAEKPIDRRKQKKTNFLYETNQAERFFKNDLIPNKVKDTKDYDLQKYITLEQLHEHIMTIDHPLKAGCKSTVIFSGSKISPLMIVGEAPGLSEDERSLPFVGESGKLLNKFLKSIGIDRNVVS